MSSGRGDSNSSGRLSTGCSERELPGVQGLARKGDRPEFGGTEYVALLTHQRVASQPRLQADLVPLSRHEPHFDQRAFRQTGAARGSGRSRPSRADPADGSPSESALRCPTRGDLRHVPDSGSGCPYTTAWYTLGRVPLELFLQSPFTARVLREHDQARRVAIDSMDDVRFALSARPQMVLDLLLHRHGLMPARQRHRQHTGGLVDHDERGVLEEDAEVVRRVRAPSLALAEPGRSCHTRTRSPARTTREPASGAASSSSRNTLPFESAVVALLRDPRRSGAARNLSSRRPPSPAVTVHCGPLVCAVITG